MAKSDHSTWRCCCPGGVVEWLMAPVLKTGEVRASVGSNPTPSVQSITAKLPLGQGFAVVFGELPDLLIRELS